MGLNKHICSFCGKEFENYFKEAKYCSQDCYKEYRKLNAKLKNHTCQNCGKTFDAHDGSVIYCSKKCAGEARQNRIECICDNCGMSFKRSKYLAERHNGTFCSKECFAEATFWSKEDEQVLLDNYGKLTYAEISMFLSRKIRYRSIGRKAKSMGIVCCSNRSEQTECYKQLCHFVRRRIRTWVNFIKEQSDYKCAITGEKFNVVVHHIRSFNLIIEECIKLSNFDVNKDFNDYSQKELDNFIDLFLDVQEYYKDYICISEDLHERFHCCYGRGDNTREQWDEFISNYLNK